MNNVAAVSGPRRLADFLRERRGAILDRWEAAVRQLRPAQRDGVTGGGCHAGAPAVMNRS